MQDKIVPTFSVPTESDDAKGLNAPGASVTNPGQRLSPASPPGTPIFGAEADRILGVRDNTEGGAHGLLAYRTKFTGAFDSTGRPAGPLPDEVRAREAAMLDERLPIRGDK